VRPERVAAAAAGAFYKGFIPNFGRLGSWNVVMFLTLEQVKKAMAGSSH
jgi:solute carrier family 25 uncoupling protein 8/9